VIDGHKRIAALQQLGRDTIEATVWAMSEAEALLLDRSLRFSPQESALEQGWLLSEMEQHFGCSLEELAGGECRDGVAMGETNDGLRRHMKDNFDFVLAKHALEQIAVGNIAPNGVDPFDAAAARAFTFAESSRLPGTQPVNRRREVVRPAMIRGARCPPVTSTDRSRQKGFIPTTLSRAFSHSPKAHSSTADNRLRESLSGWDQFRQARVFQHAGGSTAKSCPVAGLSAGAGSG
jgi:hypothetical protein